MNNSGISLICDSCGREVFSCNIVNGMKFCAKCYQETFGNQQNKESNELLVNSLAEKDRQIAELQKQLKEKEKELREIRVENYTIKSYRDFLDNNCKNLIKNNKRLKQQLKSQPAEIVEKIRKQIFNHFNVNNMEEYERLSLPNAVFTADVTTEILDTILKDYQK